MLFTLVACGAPEPGPLDAGTRDAGAGDAGVDPIPGLDDAVDLAQDAFAALGAGVPYAQLFLDVLHRRFGLVAYAGAAAEYDRLVALEGSRADLRVFRRIVALGAADPTDLDALAGVDRLTGPALHCDTVALPVDYETRLSTARAAGEYELTHVGLALGWLGENGCATDTKAPEVIAEMATLVEGAPELTDLVIEAGTLVRYLGGDRALTRPLVERLLAEQHQGGWRADPTQPGAHWHTTGLGLWLLLETREAAQGPMVTRE